MFYYRISMDKQKKNRELFCAEFEVLDYLPYKQESSRLTASVFAFSLFGIVF